MKYLLFSFIGLFSIIFISNNDEKTVKNEPFVVLQLFTSQGCSSCPSADAFLEIVKKSYEEKNVIVLSYHVDYWNSLGWKDPFSKKEYTNLQYDYGRQLKTRRVYTPQVVVNGKEHYVGSSKSKITRSIANNLSATYENSLQFSEVKKEVNKITLKYKIEGEIIDKKLQLALVLENKITKVKRGENTNRTISNSNIVINIESEILSKKKGEISISIPVAYKNEKKLRLIGYVENEELHISGATQTKI